MANKSVLRARSNSEYYAATGMQTKYQKHCGRYHDKILRSAFCRTYHETNVVERFADKLIISCKLIPRDLNKPTVIRLEVRKCDRFSQNLCLSLLILLPYCFI
jgi:hypothetical protein